MTDTRLNEEHLHATSRANTPVEEPLPLTVVPDWEEQVQHANELCRLVDRHLDYEARGRLLADLRDFRPQHLCPEQRVQMVSDCYAGTR